MIVALLSLMNRLTAASGRAARSPATSWKRTAPATVSEPTTTNAAVAIASSAGVEAGLGDRRGGGQRQREVLRVGTGERQPE
jgi:hypothetical protein